MSTFNDMPEYLANKLDKKKIELTTIGLEDMSSSVHTNSNADMRNDFQNSGSLPCK